MRNDAYAKDVELKEALKKEEAAAERERARANPFSVSLALHAVLASLMDRQVQADPRANGSALFGGDQPLFGSTSTISTPRTSTKQIPDISNLSISLSSSTTYAPPLPAYQPAQYLTTIEECLPPAQDVNLSDDDDEETPDQKAEWRDARWEQLLPKHVDVIFERFVRRLENAEGGSQQVVRYAELLFSA